MWRRPAFMQLLAIALLGELGVGVLNVATMPVYLREDRHFAEGVIGLVVTAFLLAEAAFKSFAGHLADKHGRKFFLVAAPLVWMFTPVLTYFVPIAWGLAALPIMVALRIIDGIAAAMLWPAAYAAVAESVGPGDRGKALSMLNVCFMLGLALSLPVTGFVNYLFDSYAAGLFVAALLFAGAAVVAYFFVPRKLEAGPADGRHEDYGLWDLWVCARSIPLLLAVAFVTFLGVGLPMVSIQWFAQDVFGLSQARLGAVALPIGVVMAVFSLPMGVFGERIGLERAVRLGLVLCALGLWTIALGAWVAVFNTITSVIVGGTMVGIGFLLAIPAWYASVSHINAARSGSYLGAVMTAQGIGAIIGLAAGSKFYEYGPYWPFVACAIAVTIGCLLSFIAVQTRSAWSPEEVN